MLLLRATLAFLALPGVVGFVVPVMLVARDPWQGSPGWAGVIVSIPGLAILLYCVRDFFVSGKGTLAPWDPPGKLVVVGLYRRMRNPMYVGVLLIVGGFAISGASPTTATYGLLLAVGFHIRVIGYEEPWLQAQFGDSWQHYAQHVPRWLPARDPYQQP